MSSRNSSGRSGSFWRELQIIWRLLQDDQVSPWLKIVPLLSLIYLVVPIDLIADPALGLGQLDDLLVIAMSMLMLRYLSPKASVVKAAESRPDEEQGDDKKEIVDADYRVIDE